MPPSADVPAFAAGGGVPSVILNSTMYFAMLSYTQVIGLDATLRNWRSPILT